MRIIDKSNCEEEIINLAISKAKYQKVLVCIDETSDIRLINSICNKLSRSVVLIKYYYNEDVQSFFDMANNGARVIIYNVSIEHFYKLSIDDNLILNIFVAQSNFVLPYMLSCESVYGDNLLVCDTINKDFTSIIFMYEGALFKLWAELVQNANVDTNTFKRIDRLINSADNFYINYLDVAQQLKPYIDKDYQLVEELQLPYYIYLRLCAIMSMLEKFNNGREEYIDFYKTSKSTEDVEKAYNLILKNEIIDRLKLNCENLIKICSVILNRLKIIIKKNFNFKRIKFNKLNNLIKLQSKSLNIDNLLYISYIFNSI